ncbi:MAG: uL15m family ribosomal protein [Patescibacteria group bacterium]|mgnify:CR=1 FL=1
MQLHNLKSKTKRKFGKTVGRGGKRGKTSGKGGKGQTARAGHRVRPEVRDVIKKLPKLRGYRQKSLNKLASVINVGDLEKRFESGAVLNPKVLGLKGKVKILGDGELTKKFIIENCFVSESAKNKIEKAGGTIN